MLLFIGIVILIVLGIVGIVIIGFACNWLFSGIGTSPQQNIVKPNRQDTVTRYANILQKVNPASYGEIDISGKNPTAYGQLFQGTWEDNGKWYGKWYVFYPEEKRPKIEKQALFLLMAQDSSSPEVQKWLLEVYKAIPFHEDGKPRNFEIDVIHPTYMWQPEPEPVEKIDYTNIEPGPYDPGYRDPDWRPFPYLTGLPDDDDDD